MSPKCIILICANKSSLTALQNLEARTEVRIKISCLYLYNAGKSIFVWMNAEFDEILVCLLSCAHVNAKTGAQRR